VNLKITAFFDTFLDCNGIPLQYVYVNFNKSLKLVIKFYFQIRQMQVQKIIKINRLLWRCIKAAISGVLKHRLQSR